MLKNQKNSKKQGDVGLGSAIAFYTSKEPHEEAKPPSPIPPIPNCPKDTHCKSKEKCVIEDAGECCKNCHNACVPWSEES